MNKIVRILFGLCAFFLTLHADDLTFHSNEENTPPNFFEIESSCRSATTRQEDVSHDTNITASAATLEAGPSAIVAGCVNAITGAYFDSGIDLILPGPEPIVIQHTYCSSNGWNFSHMPRLEVGFSKHGNRVKAMYTDDNGSGLPFEASLSHHEPGVPLRLTTKALDNLNNFSSDEISGRNKWSNANIQFIRRNGEKQSHHVTSIPSSFCPFILNSGLRFRISF